jgi:phage tail sheath protein FI
MANVRTINSPGVEVREIDLSTRAITPAGTNVLITGFAPQGPTYEIVELTSLTDFEQIYGTPTNAAERYFYYTVRQLLTNGGNPTVKVARLPYGAAGGEGTASEYSALAYPVVAVPAASEISTYPASGAVAGTVPLSSAQGYYFGEPALVKLTETQYQSIAQGNFTWKATTGNVGLSSFIVSGNGALNSLSAAGLIVLNKAKTTINEKFEGYYLNIGDSYSNNPATDYDDAGHIWSVGSNYFSDNALASNQNYTFIPDNRIGFSLSATYTSNINSLSKDVEDLPTFNIAASGYSDTLILSLFRVRPSPFSPTTTTLQYVLQEGYTGSLYSQRTVQDQQGGQPISFFLQTSTNDNSNNLQVLVNPNISDKTVWLDANGNSTKRVRVFKDTTISTITNSTSADPDYTFYTQASAYLTVGSFKPANNLYAVGTYAETLPTNQNKVIGTVSTKLDYVLNLAENTDVVDIDLVVDGGLSTIAATTVAAGTADFDDTVVSATLQSYVNALTASNGNPVTTSVLLDNWNTITAQFESFTRNRRKDCLFISDPLRQIFVTGENYKTLDDKSKNFSQNIYWPLRNSYTAYNTSYATAYANWAKINDIFTSKNVWVPFSGYAAAMMTASDALSYPWVAPAGLTRGIINGLTDLGVNPQQKQRDLLYKISLNPVVFFPNEGYTVFGQKTLLKAPSAFDRINVRRLFLYLEKATLRTMRYFVFEPNTTFTRSRTVNTLSPLFETAKNTQGLYDYLIVCNETNNTANVIDDNTMVVDIYIKPVRTAEFILVNFYATKTSQDFNELLQA